MKSHFMGFASYLSLAVLQYSLFIEKFKFVIPAQFIQAFM